MSIILGAAPPSPRAAVGPHQVYLQLLLVDEPQQSRRGILKMFSSLPRCATARALQGLPATSRGGGQRTAREPSPAIKNGRTSNAAERGRLRQVGGSAPRGCARGGVSALTALREGSRGTGAEAAPRDEPAPARARWASITKCHQQLVCRVNGVCFCDALIARASPLLAHRCGDS